MAFLIKIGHIPLGKSTLEYVDIFGFKNTSRSLPTGIQKIKSNNKRTIIYLDSKYIKEVSRLYADRIGNPIKDQETDYPISNCQKQIDQFTYDKLLYVPAPDSITLGNHKFDSVISVSVWHLTKNTTDILINYNRVGVGKINLDDPSLKPLAPKA